MKAIGIQSKTAEGTSIQFVNPAGETIAQVTITPTDKARKYLAVEESGLVFGYRHSSIAAAIKAVTAGLRVEATIVSRDHPSVAKLLTK